MTRPSIAVFPGSFDPFTCGHLDLVQRASQCVDELVIAVGTNRAKTHTYTASERVEMIRSVIAGIAHVRVKEMRGTVVDFCHEVDARFVIKGIRGNDDVSAEMPQAVVNREIGGVETLWIPTAPEYAHVSSSLVRELFAWGMDISRYVPPQIYSFMRDNRANV
ncbi:pantetheine-phosphate adenylyltransferase [Schaalia sp. lx-260]|uniref:pantetheine-phosphate adenylyltransferase n=1 Tax=Schaalia sp. lx-260 TaxID=2899082 RepID=UPI001E382530|nr:pantetheine-phosphate adenylyltransferase [Schaalia sp. lx-260]MCD4549870.1 pantetheine-phosphate adenylyltransferase [Schaalia sp. lx-260]